MCFCVCVTLAQVVVPLQADKRAHHNALERKRRDHIKDSFHGLRDSVPSLQGEKVSRKKILCFIFYYRRKETCLIQGRLIRLDNLRYQIDQADKQTSQRVCVNSLFSSHFPKHCYLGDKAHFVKPVENCIHECCQHRQCKFQQTTAFFGCRQPAGARVGSS